MKLAKGEISKIACNKPLNHVLAYHGLSTHWHESGIFREIEILSIWPLDYRRYIIDFALHMNMDVRDAGDICICLGRTGRF